MSANSPTVQESGDTHDEINRWNLQGVKAGVNSDVDGRIYAAYTRTAGAPNTYTIDLYSDSARTNLVATGTGTAAEPVVWPPVAPNELTVTLSEASNSGLSGTVNIQNWSTDNNSIELAPADIGLTGRRRSDNVFATFADVIDAGTANDTGTLHNLIGNFNLDDARVLEGRSEVGSRSKRFELLTNRLADESASFQSIYTDRIDLDLSSAIVDFQAQSNIFNAALSVAGRIVPMSLADYL